MQGTRLGPYEILQQLGAGGMGEVWLAQDTRLGRKVAVKVLPEQFASDPQRLARFEQEARAAAALNHPHIAVVHDVGHDNGVHFIVQEYLEGHTLRTMLERGRLPLLQGLELALEIAEALGAAHAAGIVHRDLKPENVFVSPDGHAKVLDFGLAKLTEMAASGTGSASLSPTVLGTVAGQIMGTAGYLAPEQIEGGSIDHRADLFSFGCVLYELAAGRRAFRGKNMIETLDRVANRDPDELATIDGALPAELARILDKALAKNPAARYQSAGDLAVDLRALSGAVESGKAVSLATTQVGESVPGRPSLAWIGGVGTVALLAGGLFGAWLARPVPEPEPLVHLEFDKATDGGFTRAGRRVLTISPDGRRVAFTDDDTIQVRSLDDPALVPVRGTSNPSSPNFSPDGEWIAYWADGELRKISVQGGSPIRLASIPHPTGMSWDAGGSIVAAVAGEGDGARIVRVDGDGGDPEVLVQLEPGEEAQGPSLLPGGDWVLFSMKSGTAAWDTASVVAQSLGTTERRLLVAGGAEARFVAPGHLTFARGNSLFAVSFDASGIEVTSGPVPVLEGLTLAPTGGAYYELSANGTLTFVTGADAIGDRQLAFYDLDGNLETLPLEPAPLDEQRMAPDGRRIAAQVFEDSGAGGIWIYDIGRGTRQRLSDGERSYRTPVWTPDGAWVYFTDGSVVYRARSDFSGTAEVVLDGLNNASVGSFSADGLTAAISHQPGSEDRVVSLLDVESGELRAGAAGAASGQLSPDGLLLAVRIWENGGFRVYVHDLQTGQRQIVSTQDAEDPAWSADGRALYFLTNPAGVNVVEVFRENPIRLGVARELFQQASPRFNSVHPTPDGRRLLALVPTGTGDADADSRSRIHVILNWTDELARRVRPR